jgi:hypothetical protein
MFDGGYTPQRIFFHNGPVSRSHKRYTINFTGIKYEKVLQKMIKPGGTTGLYRGRVMKKKVVCSIRITLNS